jgi:hypothetical protein
MNLKRTLAVLALLDATSVVFAFSADALSGYNPNVAFRRVGRASTSQRLFMAENDELEKTFGGYTAKQR